MVKQVNWLASVSDMMAGLMMIFMFIAVSYMLKNNEETLKVIDDKNTIKQIASQVKNTKTILYNQLYKEFESDLPKWQAEIDTNNTIRFNEPNVLFDNGQATLKNRFKEILSDFFPRYIRVIKDPRFLSDIEEIRIEGHTSSEWEGTKDFSESYVYNAKLSQERAFEVLNFCFCLHEMVHDIVWMSKILRANGVSFGKTILDSSGNEDKKRSRRVEFRILSKTEEKIYQILEVTGQ